jgi:hypothetical protein
MMDQKLMNQEIENEDEKYIDQWRIIHFTDLESSR